MLDFIVMQMRKVNREKGYYDQNTGKPLQISYTEKMNVQVTQGILHGILLNVALIVHSISNILEKNYIWQSFGKFNFSIFRQTVDPDQLNPLNPNIKISILICYPYAFPMEEVGRIC